MAPAAAFPVPSIMGTAELTVFDGLPIHHVHGTNDWMFDISQVREADGRAAEVLGETWSFTELSDWTHASPAKVRASFAAATGCPAEAVLLTCTRLQVNSEVIWPWFAGLPSLPEPPELLAVLQTLAPEIFEEEE